MPLTASLALSLSAIILPSASLSNAPAVMPQAQTVKEYVEIYFADAPVMVDIARCESQFRQFDKKGNVLKNPKSSAVGIFQVMSSIHVEDAKDKGMDIYSIEGNLEFARHLYEEKGTKPWNASKACWSRGSGILAKN